MTSTLAVTPALDEAAGRGKQEPGRISCVRGAENAVCLCCLSTRTVLKIVRMKDLLAIT